MKRKARCARNSLLLTMALWCLSALLPVPVQAIPLQEMDLPTDVPWTIKAEQFATEEEGKVILAHGRVVLQQKTDRITAEHIRLDLRTRSIDAWGSVAWYHGSDIIQAERVKIDLNTSIGKIYKGRIFISGNHFYINAQEMDKTGPDTYSMRGCTLTSCDGSSPDWLVQAESIQVTMDGYGQTSWPRFKIKGMPVLMLPWAAFPAKTSRQSGFLGPQFYDSSRDGFSWDLPFYWAWADWGETTFHWQHSGRGEGLGAELKFKLGDNKDIGLFYFDYLKDNKAAELHEAGELDKSDSDRYWLRGMFRANKLLPYGIRVSAIVDRPSDKDFIENFLYWGTGLAKINREFSKYFGSTLGDETEAERLNRLQLRKYWTGAYAVIDFQYLYDPSLRPGGQDDDTFQKLPTFTYSYSDKPIGESDLYYNFRVKATNRWREQGEWGRQGDAIGNLYGVYSLGPYLNAVPSTAFQTTMWQVVPENGDVGPEDGGTEFRSRFMWSAGLDLSTTIFKIYDLNQTSWKRMKHLIQPRVALSWRPPFHDPAPTSFSDKADPIEKVTYGLTTTLTVKQLQGQGRMKRLQEEMWRRRNIGRLTAANWGYGDEEFADMEDDDLQTELNRQRRLQELRTTQSYRYREFVRLELNQSYDIREAHRTLTAGETRRPFSAVKAELWVNPSYHFRHRALIEYDFHSGKFARLNLHARVMDARGDSLSVSFRQRWLIDEDREDVRQIQAAAGVNLFGPFSVEGEWVYDLKDSTSIRQNYALVMTRQCWGIGIGYTKTDTDERYGIFFSLLGLGEIYRFEQSRNMVGQ